MAGAVPIYMGAKNIQDFLPGDNSIIDIRDYDSARDLYNHLKLLIDNDAEYSKYHAWKQYGLSESFLEHLDRCAYYAECRICERVLSMKYPETQ